MKSLGERLEEARKDPKKLKRVFTIVWFISYGMLIVGFVLILWVLLYGR